MIFDGTKTYWCYSWKTDFQQTMPKMVHDRCKSFALWNLHSLGNPLMQIIVLCTLGKLLPHCGQAWPCLPSLKCQTSFGLLGKFMSQVMTGHLFGWENGGGWWGGWVKWFNISSSDAKISMQSGQPIWVNFKEPSTCFAGSPPVPTTKYKNNW